MRLEELRTPPLGLALALGRPDLHDELASVLKQLKPPLGISSRGTLAEASEALKQRSRKRGIKLALRQTSTPGTSADGGDGGTTSGRGEGARRTNESTSGRDKGEDATVTTALRPASLRGILKRTWLAKHRNERPAVVVVIIDNLELDDDGATRASLETSLEKLYGVAHNAGAACCVVVAAPGPGLPDVLPEDKASVIRRVLRVDNRAIITLNTAFSREVAWNKAARVAQELAVKHYEGECERMTTLAIDPHCPPALKTRYAFKAGAYAEFRQDWANAVRRYRIAYDALPEVREDASMNAQDVIEALEVSEVLHIKLCVLLLHSGSPTEAVNQAEAHMRKWSRSPLKVLPKEALPTFHEWCARQYNVFGDLLKDRLPAPAPAGTPRTHLPAYYFHAAARCSIERRQAFDAMADSSASEANAILSSVEMGSYVGQMKRRGTDDERLSSEEYISYLRIKDSRDAISRQTIELLTKAHEHYKLNSAGTAGGRSFAALISELANEYLHAGDYESAQKLFTTVAAVYRRESWTELLCAVLMNLKQCAKALRDDDAYLSICLEMSTFTGDEHAPAAFASAMAAMNEPREVDEDDVPTVMCEDDLANLFILKAGFATSECVPGEPVKFHLAVRSNLAGPIDVTQMDVEFTEDEEYEWGDSTNRTLLPGEWLKLSFDVIPKCGYVCEAQTLVLTTKSGYELVLPFVSSTSDCSPANADFDALPASVLRLKIKTHKLDVRDAPPRASISISTPDGPALVGEMSRVIINVVSVADELEDAMLNLRITEGDETSSNVQILSDSGQVIRDGKVNIGDIALRARWTGTVCLRWTGDCPPAALHVSLTAKRTGARMTEMFKDRPRTAAVENVAQILCDAPFTVKRAYLPAYRQSPLIFQDDKCSKSPPVGVMLATMHIGGPAQLTVDDVRSHDKTKSDDSNSHTKTEVDGNVTYNEGDAFLHLIPLRSHNHGEDSIRIKWHRTHGDSRCVDGVPTKILNEYCLPDVTGSKPPLVVHLKCPPKLFLGETCTYEVCVVNSTTSHYDITVAVTDSTGFIFAGMKRGTMYAAPLSSSSYYFSLVPIETGSLVLPELTLSVDRFTTKFIPPVESRRVFVRPAY